MKLYVENGPLSGKIVDCLISKVPYDIKPILRQGGLLQLTGWDGGSVSEDTYECPICGAIFYDIRYGRWEAHLVSNALHFTEKWVYRFEGNVYPAFKEKEA
jgi:hypothetical protein